MYHTEKMSFSCHQGLHFDNNYFLINFQLQHEARLSLEYLDSSFMDSFEVLFMKPVPFIQAFDQFLQ